MNRTKISFRGFFPHIDTENFNDVLNYQLQAELTKRITMAIISIRSDYKWNIEAFEVILKRQFLVTSLWDQYMAREMMDAGANQEAAIFATRLVKTVTGGDVTKLPLFKEVCAAV